MSDLSEDEAVHVEMVKKSRVHHADTESAVTSLGGKEVEVRSRGGGGGGGGGGDKEPVPPPCF